MGATEPSDKKPSPQEQFKPYLKYSGMAAQMIVILVVAAFGGRKLDTYFEMKHPVFTIVLMLTGVIVAMYSIVSSVIKNK
jgi:F0F1-type ATP synthase assembly protein I